MHPGHRLLDDHTPHVILEAAVEERIRADKDERLDGVQRAGAAVEEVEEPPGGRDEEIDAAGALGDARVDGRARRTRARI